MTGEEFFFQFSGTIDWRKGILIWGNAVGKDVSALFPDVVKSMQTTDIEIKKLVYLYIINYAKAHRDNSILVVNSFQKAKKTLILFFFQPKPNLNLLPPNKQIGRT